MANKNDPFEKPLPDYAQYLLCIIIFVIALVTVIVVIDRGPIGNREAGNSHQVTTPEGTSMQPSTTTP